MQKWHMAQIDSSFPKKVVAKVYKYGEHNLKARVLTGERATNWQIQLELARVAQRSPSSVWRALTGETESRPIYEAVSALFGVEYHEVLNPNIPLNLTPAQLTMFRDRAKKDQA